MGKQATPSLPGEARPTVSVVIPVYRAEKTLPDLYDQLSAAMPQLASAFEIIFVEDGGGDGSWRIIVGLAGKDDRVRGIRLSRNYGQHNALRCGIRSAPAVEPVFGHAKAEPEWAETISLEPTATPPTPCSPPPATTSDICSIGWLSCCP